MVEWKLWLVCKLTDLVLEYFHSKSDGSCHQDHCQFITSKLFIAEASGSTATCFQVVWLWQAFCLHIVSSMAKQKAFIHGVYCRVAAQRIVVNLNYASQ
jgi:hypothetical protein